MKLKKEELEVVLWIIWTEQTEQLWVKEIFTKDTRENPHFYTFLMSTEQTESDF